MSIFYIKEFWHIVIMCFLAIFPPVNPIGTALIVDPFLKQLSHAKRIQASLSIAFYSFSICLVSILIGSQLFKLFGISIPAVQIAGGLLIFRLGYQCLYPDEEADIHSDQEKNDTDDFWDKTQSYLFYPLAFPMTTGAGTISVLLSLSVNPHEPGSSEHIMHILAMCLGSLLMCLLVFLCYGYAPKILGKLGKRGQIVLSKLSGFITICVGIQVFLNGIIALSKLF